MLSALPVFVQLKPNRTLIDRIRGARGDRNDVHAVWQYSRPEGGTGTALENGALNVIVCAGIDDIFYSLVRRDGGDATAFGPSSESTH